MRLATRVTTLVMLAGCGHSDPFVNVVPPVDASAAAPDVRLTYNAEQDYWPAWTEDGRGIIYSFVDPGSQSLHRCVGILPSSGGPRIWQLCDNRSTQGDSINGFSGYALSATGQLLYAEAASTNRQLTALPKTTLWLADTAKPFARTQLLTLPAPGLSSTVSWLTEIRWTGPATFVALGQLFETIGHCFTPNFSGPFCSSQDSLFFQGGAVITGTIAGGHATLQVVSGTDGATGYSLAEAGASIVFTRAHDMRLWKVAATGGTAAAITTIPQPGDAEILGVSCQGSTCVAASGPVSLTVPSIPAVPHMNPGSSRLDAVSLTAGTIQLLQSSPASAATVYSTPQISPAGGNVVMQIGGTWWGHLQTFEGGGNSDLHLFAGLVH